MAHLCRWAFKALLKNLAPQQCNKPTEKRCHCLCCRCGQMRVAKRSNTARFYLHRSMLGQVPIHTCIHKYILRQSCLHKSALLWTEGKTAVTLENSAGGESRGQKAHPLLCSQRTFSHVPVCMCVCVHADCARRNGETPAKRACVAAQRLGCIPRSMGPQGYLAFSSPKPGVTLD